MKYIIYVLVLALTWAHFAPQVKFNLNNYELSKQLLANNQCEKQHMSWHFNWYRLDLWTKPACVE